MRKVLLMVFAVGMFMALGTAGASASSGSDGKPCNYSGANKGKNKCKPKPCPAGKERKDGKCKPKPCPAGQERHGSKCKPKPCPAGQERHGSECKPKPCPAGQERHGSECKPKPVECKPNEIKVDGKCKPRPVSGPCSKADLVLLEDLLKGTGGLLCVYLGDNAPNADETKNCSGAALALPIDHLLGACLFLPPVDIKSDSGPSGTTPTVPAAPSLTDLPSSLTAVLDLVLKLKLK